jgi:hypothetical protein
MTEEIKTENDSISWEIPEYQGEKKTMVWYTVASLVSIVLLAYAIFTKDWIFAVIIIFAAVMLIIIDGQKIGKLGVVISDKGVQVGKEFYRYEQIDNFFIVYEPEEGVKNLYLEFKRFARPTLPESEPTHYEWLLWVLNFARTRFAVPLENINPVIIRRNLLKYLKENTERTNIPLSEQLTKLLKL